MKEGYALSLFDDYPVYIKSKIIIALLLFAGSEGASGIFNGHDVAF